MSLLDLVEKLTKKYEGFSNLIYKDTKGIDTTGYGRNLEIYPLTEEEKSLCFINGNNQLWIPEEISAKFLREELKKIIAKLETKDYFIDLDTARKCVVTDMVYNMGFGTFNKYKKLQEALRQKDFNKACYEIEYGANGSKSKYFLQTKTRAIKNIEIMRTGDVTLI